MSSDDGSASPSYFIQSARPLVNTIISGEVYLTSVPVTIDLVFILYASKNKTPLAYTCLHLLLIREHQDKAKCATGTWNTGSAPKALTALAASVGPTLPASSMSDLTIPFAAIVRAREEAAVEQNPRVWGRGPTSRQVTSCAQPAKEIFLGRWWERRRMTKMAGREMKTGTGTKWKLMMMRKRWGGHGRGRCKAQEGKGERGREREG